MQTLAPSESACPSPRPRPVDSPTFKHDLDDPEVDQITIWQSTVEKDLERIEKYAGTENDDFAGVWLDNDARKIQVRFANNVEVHSQAIKCLISDPDVVLVEETDFTLAELEAIADRISMDADELRSQGIQPIVWDADERKNKVTIGVLEINDRIRDALNKRYGEKKIYVYKANPVRPD